jgi:hypothetical protein
MQHRQQHQQWQHQQQPQPSSKENVLRTREIMMAPQSDATTNYVLIKSLGTLRKGRGESTHFGGDKFENEIGGSFRCFLFLFWTLDRARPTKRSINNHLNF